MLKLYGIYYTFYAFEEDESQGKNRPIIILDPNNLNKGFYITSSNKYDDEDYSYPIQKYQGTGLKKSSWIRFDKAVKNLKDNECKLIGFLGPFDIKYASMMYESYRYLTENSHKTPINSYVKTFLEENKNILDDLPKLYEESLTYGDFYTGNLTPLLTKTLLDAGIDPLNSLSYIPPYYRFMEDYVRNIEIPKHILKIGNNAFEFCSELISVIIPESVLEVDALAFANCFKIAKLEIKNPNMLLGLGAFEDFISTIKFNGTEEQWNEFKKKNAWEPDTNRLILIDKIIAR